MTVLNMGMKMRGMKNGKDRHYIPNHQQNLKFEYIKIAQDYVGHTLDVTDPHKRSLFHNHFINKSKMRVILIVHQDQIFISLRRFFLIKLHLLFSSK